jgi:hypothetical protein
MWVLQETRFYFTLQVKYYLSSVLNTDRTFSVKELSDEVNRLQADQKLKEQTIETCTVELNVSDFMILPTSVLIVIFQMFLGSFHLYPSDFRCMVFQILAVREGSSKITFN